MKRRQHSRTSLSSSRVFAALVIVSLLLAVVPYGSTPQADAQNGETTTYIAEKYNCPPGYEPAIADPGTTIATCIELSGGIPYTISSTNPAYPGDTRNTDGNGQSMWIDIPFGTAYTVSESIPE